MIAGWFISPIFLILCFYLAMRGTAVLSVRVALVGIALACPLAVWLLGNALSRAAISEVTRNHKAIEAAVVGERPVRQTLGWESRAYFYAASATELGVTLRLRTFPFHIVDIDLETGQVVSDRAFD
ncbi:hypothetical protein [Pinirhizobacter soli]|uniref:hypothetical protein n=1 Tax=Pinirhizobacter soli TaxID=2786953 RepID=UPI00202AAAF6|nr:hypothetical protein [Pinirhizobacter soli]